MPELHVEPSPTSKGAALEIERKYLLDRLPILPPGTEVIEIEQGYFCKGGSSVCPVEQDVLGGRIRRAIHADGTVRCTHTIKRGSGLVRTEIEQPITVGRFEQQWPLTEGRRLTKTRYRVPHAGFVWEVDVFRGLPVVLAEVELPNIDAAPPVPPWLAPHLVREVTDDPAFRNYALALRAAREHGGSPRDETPPRCEGPRSP
jgi:CYTH domain-containing protein